MTAYDVAVVGAGVVGLGAALAASERGLRVVVVDREHEPQGASIRNFGHLCLTPQSGTARAFAALARPIWLRLAREAGIPVRPTGTLVAARAADELAVLEQLAATRSADQPVFGGAPEVGLLTRAQAEERMPVSGLIGGAFLPYDLQADPRHAAPALRAHLAARGVEFRLRTAALGVAPGALETSRGRIDAGTIVVAANHDVDLLFPELAERAEVVRCALEMLRVDAELGSALTAPLLTGWSLVRYSATAATDAGRALRERLHAEHPVLAALDVNLMATPQADGTLLLGDTHARAASASPFQSEHAFDALLDAAAELFGTPRPRVVERWQGVYASGRDEFLIGEPLPGVHVATVTTGIGMTIGLGLAEHVVARATAASLAPPTTTKGLRS